MSIDQIKTRIKKTKAYQSFFRWRFFRRQRRRFTKDFEKFVDLGGNQRFKLNWSDRQPCLEENTPKTNFDPHYVYHIAWAARVLAHIKPALHVDISSSIHFCSVVSAFIDIDFYDYRPVELDLSGLQSRRGDLMNLPFETTTVESLSCMHVVEHVGLGRYGEPLDPDGDMKAIKELMRVLKTGGNLLFVVPIGQPRIQFNAHRIYDYEQIIAHFSDYQVVQFAMVNDHGEFLDKLDINKIHLQSYACGCWWFRKP
jgi:SAM-dependent methyltransferase